MVSVSDVYVTGQIVPTIDEIAIDEPFGMIKSQLESSQKWG